LNYGGARLVGGILILGGFAGAARGLALIYPPAAVRMGLVPAMLLWATISFYDFTGYTSEQGAIFLLLASAWPLLAGILRADLTVARCARRLALGGFLLGSVPYAKLQGVPLAFAFAALALIALARQTSRSRKDRVHLVAALLAGGLLPQVLLLGYLLVWGLVGQFWTTYVLGNLAYVSSGDSGWASALAQSWAFTAAAPGLRPAIFGAAFLCFAWVVVAARPLRPPDPRPWVARPRRTLRQRMTPHWRRWSPRGTPLAVLAACLVICSSYTVLAPRHLFTHYLQFLGVPLGFIGVLACGEIWPHLAQLRPLARRFLVGSLIMGAALPVLLARAQHTDPDMGGSWAKFHGDIRHPVSVAISKLARPGDTMTVWGWMPFFYVETGLPQATRDGNSQRLIQDNPLLEFYWQRFLRDFETRPPRIFVDAVGGDNFAYDDTELTRRHENFPALQAIIARDYYLEEELRGSRIYLRRK
jgi:hypothetical protein